MIITFILLRIYMCLIVELDCNERGIQLFCHLRQILTYVPIESAKTLQIPGSNKIRPKGQCQKILRRRININTHNNVYVSPGA